MDIGVIRQGMGVFNLDFVCVCSISSCIEVFAMYKVDTRYLKFAESW